MAIYSGFSHEKWWFSIAILVHQRVPSGTLLQFAIEHGPVEIVDLRKMVVIFQFANC